LSYAFFVVSVVVTVVCEESDDALDLASWKDSTVEEREESMLQRRGFQTC